MTLDDEGVPYELPLNDQSITSELIGAFHAPNGILRTMDGGAAQVDPIFFSADIAPNVDFGAAETFDLSIVWSDDVILGVRLDVPDSEVMWWTAFERAYGTDGGVGAIMAESVLTELQANPLGENELLLDFAGSEQYILGDFDGVEGNDTIVFSNGWGDGAFPMTTAYDENDQLVSLFVFDNERHPWSLVIDEGTPPVDVTSRRTELQDCLAGRRDVIVHWNWTECPNDAPF